MAFDSLILGPADLPQLASPLILFGGSFDPVQRAHTTIARRLLADTRFSSGTVLFVPARRNPLKVTGPIASNEDRVQMLSLAIAAELPGNKCRILTTELERSGDAPSYTIETVREVRGRLNRAQKLCLLLGSDSARHFEQWREYVSLLEALDGVLIVARSMEHRAQTEEVRGRLPEALQHKFEAIDILEKVLPISSTQVRECLQQGKSLDGLVAPGVEQYIKAHGLYA